MQNSSKHYPLEKVESNESTPFHVSDDTDAKGSSAYRGVKHSLDLARYIGVLDETAAEAGLTLTLGDDFGQYVRITEQVPGKPSTYPNFRPDSSRILPGDGFWIQAVDRSGEIAHLQANRLYDLRGTNLAEHLESLRAFYNDPTRMAPTGSSCTCLAPGARAITGLVSYHGDYWLREDCRGHGMYKTLSRLAQTIAVTMWWPDFLFGLVSLRSMLRGRQLDERLQRVAMKRISTIYGSCSSEPHGSILRLPSENIEDDDWVIWSTPQDVLDAALKAIRNRTHDAAAP